MLKKLTLSISLFGLTSAAIALLSDKMELAPNKLNTAQFAFNCATVTDTPYEECEILVALYKSTGGENWRYERGWLKTNNVCNWYGMICSDGHVSDIYLAQNNLAGSIPSELSNLSNLSYLSLRTNQLTGSIPSELGNLINLENLWLDDNQLTGSIPTELGNLTNLQKLWLDNNQLTGSIPTELGNLSELQYLHLNNNQLTGSIPSELGNLTNLRSLRLYGNQLTGSIPSELGNLIYLWYLYLNNNQLTGSIPTELGDSSNLYKLYLGGNQLTGSIPTELGNLTNLYYLNLSGNQLTGSIPIELGNFSDLYYLNLSINQLTGSIPSKLGDFIGLRELYLNDNELTGSIPSELGNLSKLKWLDLGYNQLTGSIPSELGNLTKLRKLYLSNNQLCGEIPVELKNLSDIPLPSHQYGNKLRLDKNHLTASNSELIAWLDSHNPGWDETQTPCPLRLQFSSATYSVVENTGQATIIVTRTDDSDGAVSVEYATSDDTATASDDYTQTKGTLNWNDGDDADKTFPIDITDNSTPENDKTFVVSLGNPTGGIELGEPDTAIVTIMDNDSAFGCEKVTAIGKKECQTLIALYNSTGGENWVDNTGWKVTNSPCNWYGVSCQGGRVTRLALGDNNLKGSISKKLSKLKKLTELDLNDNCLKTKVSKKLGKWLNKLNPGWDETQTDCLD